MSHKISCIPIWSWCFIIYCFLQAFIFSTSCSSVKSLGSHARHQAQQGAGSQEVQPFWVLLCCPLWSLHTHLFSQCPPFYIPFSSGASTLKMLVGKWEIFKVFATLASSPGMGHWAQSRHQAQCLCAHLSSAPKWAQIPSVDCMRSKQAMHKTVWEVWKQWISICLNHLMWHDFKCHYSSHPKCPKKFVQPHMAARCFKSAKYCIYIEPSNCFSNDQNILNNLAHISQLPLILLGLPLFHSHPAK